MKFLKRIFGSGNEPQRAERANVPMRSRAFSKEFFLQGVGAAAMLAESHGQAMHSDPFTLTVREALELILADALNGGNWDSLPFANWGNKPYLPGQMVFSLEMAERPSSGGLRDAYVVFRGGGPGAIVYTGIPVNPTLTLEAARTRLVEALEPSWSPRCEPMP